MSDQLYPLRFRPVYKDYLWGGDRIIKTFNRDEPDGVYAESWEVADRDDGMSVVTNGAWAGKTLREVIETLGPDLLGAGATKGARFPLLIKLIDARERLSVQVHPSNETAAKYGGEAKTEMWYILDADPHAGVFAGLRPGIRPERFEEAIAGQEFGDVLQSVPVAPGDAIFTPGGRVHAIDAGCLILEVQQNSNTTYRIYDWGRVGADGKPRDVHIEEAMKVILWHDDESARVESRRLGFLGANELWQVLSCPYFRLERLVLKEEWNAGCDGKTFHVLFVRRGNVSVQWDGRYENLTPGSTCLVPAALPSYNLKPDEEAEVLRVTVP